MRTGEFDGLQWKSAELDNNLILVREVLEPVGWKRRAQTEISQRGIPMLPMERAAIECRLAVRDPCCPWMCPALGRIINGFGQFRGESDRRTWGDTEVPAFF